MNSTKLTQTVLNNLKAVKETTDAIWVLWTIKSANIPFKTTIKGVGDGEQKVASELNTIVLGQNSDYDMVLNINGLNIPCDVKKLDANTFNTGVKGRNALRPIKQSIADLITIFHRLSEITLFSEEERGLLAGFDDISPDELCVSNIRKINLMCESLNKHRTILSAYFPTVTPFIDTDGVSVDMTLDKYFTICQLLQLPFPSKYESFLTQINIYNELSHKYIVSPSLLKEELDKLVSIFDGLKLIFVDEKKGYCIWEDMSKIKFERITRGHPRFRVLM